MADYYVDTDNGASGNAGTSWGAAKAKLSQAAALVPTTFTENIVIHCKGTAADTYSTEAIAFFNSAYNMGSYSLTIQTDAADRHDGKWNTSKYRIEYTSTTFGTWTVPLGCDGSTIGTIIYDGLQIKLTTGNTYQTTLAWNCNPWGMGASEHITIRNCLVWGKLDHSNCGFGAFYAYSGASGYMNLYNNVFYQTGNASTGGATIDHGEGGTMRLYNNIVYGGYIAYRSAGVSTWTIKNCITQNSANDGFSLSGTTTAGYNISSRASDCPSGTGNLDSTTLTFTDAANGDFSTAVGQANIDAGTNSVDSLFTTDIKGNTREGTWDIGPYELIVASPTMRESTTYTTF